MSEIAIELWLISGGDFEGVFMQRRNCACDAGSIASRRPDLCGRVEARSTRSDDGCVRGIGAGVLY
jgi:hypothetical protein